MDLEFLLQFGDAPAGGHEFGLIGAGDAGYLAGVDQVLAAPEVDALLADVQVAGYLRDTSTRRDQIEDLPTELWRVSLGYAERSSELLGSVIIQ
jgi:hypothetical protein